MQRLLILLITSVLLSACALEPEFTPQRCSTENWYSLGLSKGMAGNSLDSYQRYQSRCAQYGIAVNVDSYRMGWEKGIRSYCGNPNNAYQLGYQGQAMPNFCPADMNALFYATYQNGQLTRQREEKDSHHKKHIEIQTEKVTEKIVYVPKEQPALKLTEQHEPVKEVKPLIDLKKPEEKKEAIGGKPAENKSTEKEEVKPLIELQKPEEQKVN